MNGIGADSERVSPQQQLTVDYMQMAGHRSIVHGLVELDITDARERIQTIKKETGTKLSFTAFIVSCLATTVEEQPHVQRYRDWQGRIHEFEGVDVNVLIEQETDGEQIGILHVIRQANQRTVRSIHDEPPKARIRQTCTPSPRLSEPPNMAAPPVVPDTVEAPRRQRCGHLCRHVRHWKWMGHQSHELHPSTHRRRHRHQTTPNRWRTPFPRVPDVLKPMKPSSRS